ncbi:MAG: hypothetical protein ACTTKH_00260 [Treponema sp.]
MEFVLFDENENISCRLGNIIKEKYNNVTVYNNLLCFLESLYDNNNFMNVIFIFAEDSLTSRNMNIKSILKKFDFYSPILIYSIKNDIFLKLEINYIYEYQKDNCEIYADYIATIEECFDQFANDKEFFSYYNFQCLEVPLFLSPNMENQEIHALYERVNIKTQKETGIIECLTKMQAKLFMFLLSHKEGGTLSDITYNLWGSNSKSKAQNVYSLMYELKKVISQKTTNKYRVVHIKDKYQLIHINEMPQNYNLCDATTDNLQECANIK